MQSSNEGPQPTFSFWLWVVPIQSLEQVLWIAGILAVIVSIAVLVPRSDVRAGMIAFGALGTTFSLRAVLPGVWRIRTGAPAVTAAEIEALLTRLRYRRIGIEGSQSLFRPDVSRMWRWPESDLCIDRNFNAITFRGPLPILRRLFRERQQSAMPEIS